MRASVLTGASLLAITCGVNRLFRSSPKKGRPQGAWPRLLSVPSAPEAFAPEGADATAETAQAFLMYFVVPLWIAAGSADAVCHRRAKIETTTGPKESLLHIIMLAEVGIPLLATLFLEVTSPILALLIASFILHEITSFLDVSYATKRREVTPIEQHVHSFLEIIPFMAASVTAILHWKQFLALIGIGDEARVFQIRLKRRPIPVMYSIAVIGASTALEWVPYIYELVRGLRAMPLTIANEQASETKKR